MSPSSRHEMISSPLSVSVSQSPQPPLSVTASCLHEQQRRPCHHPDSGSYIHGVAPSRCSHPGKPSSKAEEQVRRQNQQQYPGQTRQEKENHHNKAMKSQLPRPKTDHKVPQQKQNQRLSNQMQNSVYHQQPKTPSGKSPLRSSVTSCQSSSITSSQSPGKPLVDIGSWLQRTEATPQLNSHPIRPSNKNQPNIRQQHQALRSSASASPSSVSSASNSSQSSTRSIDHDPEHWMCSDLDSQASSPFDFRRILRRTNIAPTETLKRCKGLTLAVDSTSV